MELYNDIAQNCLQELILQLSRFDSASQIFAEKYNARLVIYDHGMFVRNVVLPKGQDGLYKCISVGFYYNNNEKKVYDRNDFHFSCAAIASCDIHNQRLVACKEIWKGFEPAEDYLKNYKIYEKALECLLNIKKSDLK